MDLAGNNLGSTVELKLVFRMDSYQSSLQKNLHKQWLDGQNCDLVISTRSSEFSVHSCVVACFSTKISDHLLQASVTRALASITGAGTYSSDDGIVKVSVLKSGEKRVQMEAEDDILQLLVKFMYTGSMHVPPRHMVALLSLAQLLGMGVVTSMVQVYIQRNPHVAGSQNSSSLLPRSHPSSGSQGFLPEGDNSGGGGGDGDKTLCLDSVELTDQTEHLDIELAAYINSSACQLSHSDKDNTHLSAVQCQGTNGRKSQRRTKNVDAGRIVKSSSVTLPGETSTYNVPVNIAPRKRRGLARKVAVRSAKPRGRPKKSKKVEDENGDVTVDDMDNFSGGNDLVQDCEARAEDEPNQNDDTIVEDIKMLESDADCDSKAGERDYDEEKYPFRCKHCSKGYGKMAELRHHLTWRHRHALFTTTTCPHAQCDKQFEDIDQFRTHCREVHSDLVCEVEACSYTADSEHKVRLHDSYSHKGKFRCDLCKLYAPTKQGLSKHVENTHTEVSCRHCKRSFIGRVKLLQHKKETHNYMCGKCGQRFVKKSHLTVHTASKKRCGTKRPPRSRRAQRKPDSTNSSNTSGQIVDTGEPLLPQTVAIKVEVPDNEDGAAAGAQPITNGGSAILEEIGADVAMDIKAEMGVAGVRKRKPYRKRLMQVGSLAHTWCRLCNKQLDSEDSYHEHLRLKHLDRVFPCPQCNKVFLRKEGVTNHVHSAHEHRKFVCRHCSIEFTVATRYKAHCVEHHGDNRPFHCPLCPFITSMAKSLIVHERRLHPDGERKQEVCDHCGSCFLYLNLHKRNCLRLEQHLCSTCGEVFPLRASLKSHVNVVHGGEKAYPCSVCHRRFSCHGNRNRHMRIHNNTFPYTCDACGQQFRHSNTLKDHLRRIHDKRDFTSLQI